MKQKKKILIIDDESDFSFFIKKNLEHSGEFTVITSDKGEEGIEMARKENPDLILLDIVMPKVSGPDVAETLLSDPLTHKIPLIFLTAVVTEQEIGLKSIKEIGGHDFIAKPINTAKLRECTKNALEGNAV